MSRRTFTSQMPVYLGNYRRGSESIFSRRCRNEIASSKVDVCLKEIENVLTAYSETDGNSCETNQSRARRRRNLIYSKQGADFSVENTENVAERDYNNCDDDLKCRNKHDDISINESGVYVVLRSESPKSDKKSGWGGTLQPGIEQTKTRSKPAISFDHSTTQLPDRLAASAILQPSSTPIRYQPYLRIDQFSDTESVVSTEVNKKDYFKKLKEFEQSVEDTVGIEHLNANPTMNDRSEGYVANTNKTDENKILESLENNGMAKNQQSTSASRNMNKDDTEAQHLQCMNEDENSSDVDVSLEDLIQDFLQYFQTKRLSVKMSYEMTQLGGDSNETLDGDEACGNSQHEAGMEHIVTDGGKCA